MGTSTLWVGASCSGGPVSPALWREDPSRDGDVGVGFQEGMGSNPSAQVKEDGSLAKGGHQLTRQVPGKRLGTLNPPWASHLVAGTN